MKQQNTKQLSLLDQPRRSIVQIIADLDKREAELKRCKALAEEIITALDKDAAAILADAKTQTTGTDIVNALAQRNGHLALSEHLRLIDIFCEKLNKLDERALTDMRNLCVNLKAAKAK